jgi:hypothetical protein
MRKAAFALGAVVLTGTVFAQQAPACKDGEDGVNRTRSGNHKPGKTAPEARKPDVKKVDVSKPDVKADAKKPLNPPKRTEKP